MLRRFDYWLALLSVSWAALVLASASASEPLACSMTLALLGVNGLGSLWRLLRNGRVVLVLGTAQLALFALLHYQLFSVFGPGHHAVDTSPQWPDWIQMIMALGSTNTEVRKGACDGLGRLGPNALPAVPALLEELSVWETGGDAYQVFRRIGPVAVPMLVRELADQDPDARANAASALGAIGPPAHAAVPVLIQALGDQHVRASAARALGHIGPAAEPAVGVLVPLLRQRTRGLRATIASALGNIAPHENLVPVLVELLADRDYYVRSKAVEALGKIGSSGGKAAVAPLREALADKDISVRHEAVDALGRIGLPAKDAIIDALASPDAEVRKSAVYALGRFQDEAVIPALCKLLEREKTCSVLMAVANTLGYMGPAAKGAVPALKKVLPCLASSDLLTGLVGWDVVKALRRIRRRPK